MVPHHNELSTQEAANMLNVIRPFLVGPLEQGEIHFRKVGTHRRVLLEDFMAYEERTDHRRRTSLVEFNTLSQDEGMGY